MSSNPWATMYPLPLEHVLVTASISRELGGVWYPCGDWDGGIWKPDFPETLLAMERN